MQNTGSIPSRYSLAHPEDRLKALLISLAPLALNWLFIVSIASGVYIWDDWDGIVGLSKAFKANGLEFSQLWVAHNEHRFFLPRFFFLASDLIFRDARFLMFLNSIVCWLTLREISIRLQIPKSLGEFRWRWLTYGVLCFFFFAWIHTENFFWDFQLSWFMETWAAVAALRAFSQKRYFKTSVYFMISFLSHAAWIVLCAVLFLMALFHRARTSQEDRKSVIPQLLVIGVVTIIGLVAYLPGIHRAAMPPFQTGDLLKLAPYTLALIGSPFSGYGIAVDIGFGTLFIFAVIWLARRYKLLNLNFAASLVLYTLIASGIFALGRFQLWDYSQKVPARYSTLIFPGWIALSVVLLHVLSNRRNLLIAIHLVLAITTIDIFFKQFDFERGAAYSRDQAAQCLQRVLANANEPAESEDRKCALYLFPNDGLFPRAKLWMENAKK